MVSHPRSRKARESAILRGFGFIVESPHTRESFPCGRPLANGKLRGRSPAHVFNQDIAVANHLDVHMVPASRVHIHIFQCRCGEIAKSSLVAAGSRRRIGKAMGVREFGAHTHPLTKVDWMPCSTTILPIVTGPAPCGKSLMTVRELIPPSRFSGAMGTSFRSDHRVFVASETVERQGRQHRPASRFQPGPPRSRQLFSTCECLLFTLEESSTSRRSGHSEETTRRHPRERGGGWYAPHLSQKSLPCHRPRICCPSKFPSNDRLDIPFWMISTKF